jgi:hypothetical protein
MDQPTDEKSKKVKVTIINSGDKTSLVQWVEDGSPKRATVKNEQITDEQVSPDHLRKGIPYGLDFAAICPAITPQQIEEVLHEYSIWTADDVRAKPALVLSALSSLNAVVIDSIRLFVKQSKL